MKKTKASKRAGTNRTSVPGLTGAAWSDKPAKTDGMTEAEAFTNRRGPR